MNIDYSVRNSIYCTPASRALSAAQLLNGPSHARLTLRLKETLISVDGIWTQRYCAPVGLIVGRSRKGPLVAIVVRVRWYDHRCKVNSDEFDRVQKRTGGSFLS
jgi:hypothetical protein